jgi:hypothetical protein
VACIEAKSTLVPYGAAATIDAALHRFVLQRHLNFRRPADPLGGVQGAFQSDVRSAVEADGLIPQFHSLHLYAGPQSKRVRKPNAHVGARDDESALAHGGFVEH